MPIWFPFLADDLYPTALYNSLRQVMVTVVLQLASTVTPEGKVIEPVATDSVDSVEKRNVVLCFCVRENIVVGITRST